MIKNLVLMFPGQGSQYVGMAKGLNTECESILAKSNQILGFDLTKLMFEGPEKELKSTSNTQPAILTHSFCLLQKLQKFLQLYPDVKVTTVMGHSVGEYAALVAAGSLDFSEAVSLVNKRGTYMQEAVPVGVGSMVALLKVPEEIVVKACQQASSPGCEIMPANYNDPGQIVISGHKEAATKAINWLKENYKEPHRAIELPVSAPFHSRLMRPAAIKMKEKLSRANVRPNMIPYVANVDAKTYTSGTNGDTIRENLYQQVEGSVMWSHSVKQLPQDVIALEVGPGKVLAGLVKKIRPDIKMFSLDNEQAFADLANYFEGNNN